MLLTILFYLFLPIYAATLGLCMFIILDKTDGKGLLWAVLIPIIPVFNLVYVLIYGNCKTSLKEIFKK